MEPGRSRPPKAPVRTPSVPPHDSETGDRILSGGVVAFNEERHIEDALDSLLHQELPPGWKWGIVWVVASGCTDRTVEIARGVAAREPNVRVLVEAERGGKARALGEILRRAEGNALVLLNSDARAENGAVAELVRVASGESPPFAVMGRPVVPNLSPSRWARMLRYMWDLHHDFHSELQRHGGGTHLSDELLLVSLPAVPLPQGIINDGSFFGVWLAQHGGGRLYAPAARVTIEIPATMRDHLHQRRRIRVGNGQVTALFGVAPSTLTRFARENPRRTIELLRGSIGTRRDGGRRFVQLGAAEVAATVLSLWDRFPPTKDHVRWQRIRWTGDPTAHASLVTPNGVPSTSQEEPERPSPSGAFAFTERRVATVLEVADQFRTGVPLKEMVALLPAEAPHTIEGVHRWLAERPDLARVENQRAFLPRSVPSQLTERQLRGSLYRATARQLLDRPLAPVLSCTRSVALTGSTAYGEPEAGDDLDLFVITRTGALWWFLAYSYVALRLGSGRRAGIGPPTPCINYVLDDRAAPDEFARGRGFLFAREALTAQVLKGDGYYRGLLRTASWMESEVPRLYAERTHAATPVEGTRAAPHVRVLNLAVYPLLAAYLQLAGLYRNAALRRRGAWGSLFRTETGLHRMTFSSRRFDRLRVEYGRALSAPGGDAGMSGPSRIPSSR